jgi:hypothetical protein
MLSRSVDCAAAPNRTDDLFLHENALRRQDQILPKPGQRRWSLPDFSNPGWEGHKSARRRHLSLLKTVNYWESLGIFLRDRLRSGGMITILSALVSVLSFRFRSRASLELELVALRHQLIALRRQRPRRLRLHSADRLLWVCLYRVWPRVLDALVLVKPATVVKWHRKGFRIYWRWRSRWRPQDEHRNPSPDPSDEPRQSALGRASHPRRTAQARHRGEPGYCRQAPPSAP